MLIAALIGLVLTIFCAVAFFATDNEGWGIGVMFFGIVFFFALLGSMNLRISTQELTGYIYSSSNRVGYTAAHIRFSQNAGTDAQPEFCVKTDSEAGRAVKKYVGSDTKVKIHIPGYFYFSNNPFACGTTNMTITETK